MPDLFESSKFSIDHAQRHIKNFNSELAAFFASEPYRQVVEFGFPNIDIHKVQLTKPLTKSLGAFGFDAIVSLRASLDQAGYAIARAAGTEGKRGHFPFGDTEAEALSRKGKKAPSEDIPQSVFDQMVSFKPYKGGDNALWAMNKICNSHKHEDITATAIFIGGGSFSVNFDRVQSFGFPPLWDSTKNEMTLAVVPRGAKPSYQLKVAQLVAFSNVQEVAHTPAERLLDELTSTCRRIIAALEGCRHHIRSGIAFRTRLEDSHDHIGRAR